MSSEKMRDDFEAWAVADAGSTDRSLKFERGGEWYLGRDHQVMNLGWAAWQASRAAVVVELPEAEAAPRNSSSYREGLADGVERGLDQARKAIEAAGLKVKP